MVDADRSDPHRAPRAVLLRGLLVTAIAIVALATVPALKWYVQWKALEQRRVALEKRREAAEAIRPLGGTVVVASATQVAVGSSIFHNPGHTIFEENEVLLVDVSGNAEFGDAELERLCAAAKPQRLNLRGTAVTDEGLKALAQIERLLYLNLRDTAITDAGVEYLVDPERHLWHLDLSGTNITDACVNSLNRIHRTCSLWLDETQITDEGLESLDGADLIGLANIRAGDSALRFRDRHVVNMHGLQITDAGLRESFDEWSGNVWWDLSDTAVTDEGIEYLELSKPMLNLALDGTAVSERGIAELLQSLPQCAVNGISSEPQSARVVAGLKIVDRAIADAIVGQPVAEVADLLDQASPNPYTKEDGVYAFHLGETTYMFPITLWVKTGEGYVLDVIVEAWTW